MILASSFLALALVSLPQPVATLPPSVDPDASCSVCHEDVAAARHTEGNPHQALPCATCHAGRGFNPHVADPVDERVDAIALEMANHAEHSPAAYAQCQNCHPEAVAAWRNSVHGLGEGLVDRPSCEACHGDIHALVSGSGGRIALAERCIACHDFEVPGRPAHVVDTYRHTIHGKKLALGDEEAATCPDCHNAHDVLPETDPASSIHPENRADTCGACHPGATAAFAAAVSHRPPTRSEDAWAWGTGVFFASLTFGTILLLFLHVIADFLRSGRSAMLARGPTPPRRGRGPVDAEAELPRFDLHMRIQHWGMMLSFILLVLTGWPLKAASVETNGGLLAIFGGHAGAALVHRVAAALLIAVSAYHLVYLGWLVATKRFTGSMIPGLRDLRDAMQNVQYFVGLREERPHFGKWTYFEKFDYWAVFWGMVIMGGSGLVLWFPVAASSWMPGQLINLSLIAHSDEALLALLAIFLWHFYNTHLRPTVFPMSWVWLTGRISAEAMYEEHRGEYELLYGQRPPNPPVVGKPWYAHALWSYLAVSLIVLVGAIVVAGNASSVRDRIRALQDGSLVHAGVEGIEPVELVGPLGAYDEGFDPFERCFACHNDDRYAGAGNFPHQRHFESFGISDTCTGCHQSAWHQSMTTATEGCQGCHRGGVPDGS
jgi:cytochrome b subunit of formate dehydrogenase